MSTEHENEAQEVLRKIARDVRAHGLPPDAGLTAELLQVVRAAWQDGQQIAALRIAQAWQLACETGETEFATWLGEEFPDGIGNSGTGNGYHQDDMQAAFEAGRRSAIDWEFVVKVINDELPPDLQVKLGDSRTSSSVI